MLNSDPAQVVVTPDGGSVVVLNSESQDDTEDFAVWDPTTQVATVVVATDEDGATDSTPNLAFAGSTPFMAWNDSAEGSVWLAYLDGGGWSAVEIYGADGGVLGSSQGPTQLAVSPTGQGAFTMSLDNSDGDSYPGGAPFLMETPGGSPGSWQLFDPDPPSTSGGGGQLYGGNGYWSSIYIAGDGSTYVAFQNVGSTFSMMMLPTGAMLYRRAAY